MASTFDLISSKSLPNLIGDMEDMEQIWNLENRMNRACSICSICSISHRARTRPPARAGVFLKILLFIDMEDMEDTEEQARAQDLPFHICSTSQAGYGTYE